MKEREMRIASGKGRFIDDLEFPNMAHLVFVGSPLAHARIRRIDTDKALEIPGVLRVITGKDVESMSNPLPPLANIKEMADLLEWIWRIPRVYAMDSDKVRFFGQPVAAVVAEDENTARAAAELIDVEYEPLPAVMDTPAAIKPDAPKLYEEWENNTQAHFKMTFGDIEAAFTEADRVIPVTYREGRASGFPVEARGCVAWYDTNLDTLTMWGNYQAPFMARTVFAETLGVPQAKLKVNTVDIGGAFGNKEHAWKDRVVALASILTGRPVKWRELQREWIATGPHQRDVSWEGEVAFKNDGRVLGIKARVTHDLGAEGTCKGGGALGLMAACSSVCNAYRWKGMYLEGIGVVTNKSFYCAYRGFAKDKGIKFVEYTMNRVARELDMNPEDIRLKNFIQPDEFPFRQINNYTYDSGDYPAVLNKALTLSDIDSWRQRQKEFRGQGKYIGLGVVFTVEPAASAAASNYVGLGDAQARVRICRDGSIEVYSDWVDLGQGSTTSQSIIVADILGCAVEDVTVLPVSSDMAGMGSISSCGAVLSASAVARASKLLKEKIKRFGAAFLGESPENLETGNGAVYSIEDPNKKLTLQQLAENVYCWPGPISLPTELLKEHDYLLDVTTPWFSPNAAENRSTYQTFCAAADIAVVDVDIETGATKIINFVHVHDAGKIINRQIVEGQIHGGIVQGIGEALTEEIVYAENGVLLSTTYVDYPMPTALDAPDIIVGHHETPSPYTELGSKGMGESPIIGSKIVMLAAIEDALSPFNVRVNTLPATRENVRALVVDAMEKEVRA